MRTLSVILLAASFGLIACTDPDPQPDVEKDVTVTWDDTYTYGVAWDMLQPICNSEGIDDDRCKCLLDLMVAEVGVDAAMYVAMTGWMHDDEAAALKDDIGEQRAKRASDIYAYEQDKTCVTVTEDEDTSEDGQMDSISDAAVAAPAD